MSTTVTIHCGLHTCKPGNVPKAGEIKCFSLEDRGDWTKIRNSVPDKGGGYYRILSAEKTNYEDKHGNISFNLELEPAEAPAPAVPQSQPITANGAPTTEAPTRNYPPPVTDTAEQFIMRSANLYNICITIADSVVRDKFIRRNWELKPEDLRQIATTLFLHAKDHGYVSTMPDKEIVKKDPY